MSGAQSEVVVRTTSLDDIPGIITLTEAVYPGSTPWTKEQLESHLAVFPQGQFVAEDSGSGRIVGMAASLIVRWDDYDITDTWRGFTDSGSFTNHDPVFGRTLYGAEVMVDPDSQGGGIGSQLYEARQTLAIQLGLLRIRAGARLRGYKEYADTMTPEEYTVSVVNGDIFDPTLSFQLSRGFSVLAVVQGYLRHDPESLGYAAIIEWINPQATTIP
jgi:GNAT superfamily N-acetyltransferase